MAAPWNEEVLDAVRMFLAEKGPGPVIREDLIRLEAEIGRPAAGIKKKILDMRALANRDEEMPQGCIRRARSPVWGEEEVNRRTGTGSLQPRI